MSGIQTSDYEQVAEFFKALANPVRAAIVHALASQERTVSQLVEELMLPQPLVSQHLRVLRGAHMVATTRRGQEIVYRILDQHIAHVVGDAYTHIQEEHLDHHD